MAYIRKDKVAETTTSTGTGNIALAGALTGYRTFASQMSVSDVCDVTITAVDGDGVPTGQWETVLATYSATNTLTRTTFVDSSTGSPINFSAGTKRVAMSTTARALNSMIVALTQAAYAALTPPDPYTLYVITD